MADETSQNEVSRAEFAANLRDIADAFDDGETVDISVENKTITLHPPDVIEQDIAVGERSSIIGSDSESVTIEASWALDD